MSIVGKSSLSTEMEDKALLFVAEKRSTHKVAARFRIFFGDLVTSAVVARKGIGLLFGVLGMIVLCFWDFAGDLKVSRCAGAAFLMSVMWITEAVPLPATALVPVFAFPMLGVTGTKEMASSYFNHLQFVFIGGFLVALAMERWNLHRRIALTTVLLFGGKPRFLLLGLYSTTWLLSMWISNTATTMAMVSNALAIVATLEEVLGKQKVAKFSKAIFLGIAFSSNIGGIATIIGTPPNLAFIRIFEITFPNAPEISFSKWFLFAFPLSLLFFLLMWAYFAFYYIPRDNSLTVDMDVFRAERAKLGKMSFAEKAVLVNFLILALMWLFRADLDIGFVSIRGWERLFEPGMITDGTVAALMSFIMFVIPSRSKEEGKSGPILDWDTAKKLPWGIVLLFGGGFALAQAFTISGLSAFIGEQLTALEGMQPWALVLSLSTIISLLTQLTSNTATAQVLVPLLASLAVGIKVHPLITMIPGTIACSFAFMMPVATPPNLIVFGSGKLTVSDMIKAGFLINVLGIILAVVASLFLLPVVFDFSPTELPPWA